MPSYPTVDQILAAPEPTYKPEALRFVRTWKREHRGARRSPEALRALLAGLAAVYDKPLGGVEFVHYGDCYSPSDGVIHLSADRGSVVTALHEFAHHRFGASELKACRWSVHLFRKTFPRTFARARFEGHLLVVDRDDDVMGQMLAAMAAEQAPVREALAQVLDQTSAAQQQMFEQPVAPAPRARARRTRAVRVRDEAKG